MIDSCQFPNKLMKEFPSSGSVNSCRSRPQQTQQNTPRGAAGEAIHAFGMLRNTIAHAAANMHADSQSCSQLDLPSGLVMQQQLRCHAAFQLAAGSVGEKPKEGDSAEKATYVQRGVHVPQRRQKDADALLVTQGNSVCCKRKRLEEGNGARQRQRATNETS